MDIQLGSPPPPPLPLLPPPPFCKQFPLICKGSPFAPVPPIFLYLTLPLLLELLTLPSVPWVQVTGGDVKGRIERTRGGRSIYTFRGIPFGKVVNRFEDSVPADRWAPLLLLAKQSALCIDAGQYPFQEGVEDCLKVDVYTPRLPRNLGPPGTLLPVIVWIYGGGFIQGSSSEYGPDYLLDHDIILVVPNYRLGVLGFLNAGTRSAPGNQGLKDQNLALRWVKDNVHSFSGDPNSVTVMGQSAGGMSISLHILSPMSRGLFHRAIIHSGPVLQPLVTQGLNGTETAKGLAKLEHCPTDNMEELVMCLRTKDPRAIQKTGSYIDEFGFNENAVNMSPSIEVHRGVGGAQTFMDRNPYDLLLAGDFAPVPIMYGVVEREALALAYMVTKDKGRIDKLNQNWTSLAPNLMAIQTAMESVGGDPKAASVLIADLFLTDGKVDFDRPLEFEALLSERFFLRPWRATLRLLAKKVPLYLFLFSQDIVVRNGPYVEVYFPPVNETKGRVLPSHGAELPYLFIIRGQLAVTVYTVSTDHMDFDLSMEMVGEWANFAKTSTPLSPVWQQYNPLDEKYLDIAFRTNMTSFPPAWYKHDQLWSTIFSKQAWGEWGVH